MRAVPRAPIAVALDAPDLATVREWTRAVSPYVSTLKVGLEVYLRDGRAAVELARDASDQAAGSPCAIFLDLKLHDIPATVAGAARSVASLEPDFLTVHAAGGAAMIAAAAEALPSARITAVTVLTSLTGGDLAALGLMPQESGPAEVARLAARLALESVKAGARAIVCSPDEVEGIATSLREQLPEYARDVVLITPGVRPAGADLGDQRRVATPQEALDRGADLLVVGRPITGASDPAAAAAALVEGIRRVGPE